MASPETPPNAVSTGAAQSSSPIREISDATLPDATQPKKLIPSLSDEKKRKRARRDTTNSDPSLKPRGAVRRVWSLKDELAILRAHACHPSGLTGSELDALAQTVHGGTFNKDKIRVKIGILKRKYFNDREKTGGGELPPSADAHHRTVYELSKKIWGSSSRIPKGNRSSSKVNASSDAGEEEGDVDKAHPPGLVAGASRSFMFPNLAALLDRLVEGKYYDFALRRAFETVDEASVRKIEKKLQSGVSAVARQQKKRMALENEVKEVLFSMLD